MAAERSKVTAEERRRAGEENNRIAEQKRKEEEARKQEHERLLAEQRAADEKQRQEKMLLTPESKRDEAAEAQLPQGSVEDAIRYANTTFNTWGAQQFISDKIKAAEASNDEAADRKFKEELNEQINGTQEEGHIYNVGMPSATLLSTGFPNAPIQMNSRVLRNHSADPVHPFELEEVSDLVFAMQNPIAIFSYGDKTKAQNVILDVAQDDKHFLVGVHFNKDTGTAEVSSIRGVFPKNSSEWLNWVNQGKLLYADKEKIQTLIDQQRKTLADVEYLDLEDAAKVVEDFENPKISPEILQKMTVWHGSPYDFDKFDHTKMGTGEGAQAHGWGTYVAKDEETGREYAETLGDFDRQVTNLLSNDYELWADEWDYEDGIFSFNLDTDYRKNAIARKAADFYDIAEKDLEYYSRERIDKLIVDYRGEIQDDIDNIAVSSRNLYEVSIPDYIYEQDYIEEGRNYTFGEANDYFVEPVENAAEKSSIPYAKEAVEEWKNNIQNHITGESLYNELGICLRNAIVRNEGEEVWLNPTFRF